MDSNNVKKTKEKSKFPFMLIFSIVYMAMIILYCLLDVKGMKTLKPNEWGDFLAGFSAPLVFMWLIYGYHQQGKELSLQLEELTNSVEQQRILADTTQKELVIVTKREERQTELETINAQPYFHIKELKMESFGFRDGGAKQLKVKFNLKNSRNLCRSLFLMYSKNYEDNKLVWEGVDFLPHDLGEGIYANFTIPYDQVVDVIEDESFVLFKFFYTDAFDELRAQILKVSIDNKNIQPYLALPITFTWLHNKNFIDNRDYY
ncbi:hypothetical protein [Acinetobacter calcoaceticus]|uniref:hypothetical protein n=1 Tax=Acinetobacter calcoaceticus TaxID=471 RepID=UPI0030094B57